MELEELHKKLEKHLEDQATNWKSFIYGQTKGFYQGFNEIKIQGLRPTEKRFELYDIEKYLSKEKTVLDIGSNCGFFALYTSRFIKDIDGVEINPYLVAIANDTKDYLKISNTMFHTSSFKKFNTEKKYDIIFSLANDSALGSNAKSNFIEYCDKIVNLLKNNGLLFFESQAIDMLPKPKFDPKLQILKQSFNVFENKIIKSEYPVNVPERLFFVLRKKF